MVVDFVIVDAVLWLSAYYRPLLNVFGFARLVTENMFLPRVLYVIFPVMWIGIMAGLSVYDGTKNLRVVDEFSSITLGSVLAGVTMAGVLFLSYRDVSRLTFISFVVVTYFIFLLWRSIARLFYRVRNSRSERLRHVMLVGAGDLGREVEEKLRSSSEFFVEFVGFVDDDPAKRKKHKEILGSLDDTRSVIAAKHVEDVVIALPPRAQDRLNQVIEILHELPVRVWLVPDYLNLALHSARTEDFLGIPMLDLRAAALTETQRMFKRGFDLIATPLALVIFLPVMALIALAIWLDDGRPILFRQKRAGENGRKFTMYKFRTMVRGAEKMQSQVEKTDSSGNIVHKREDDPRVTRVGRILRRLSLDELPQLFNVLTGKMSLVGPRPELIYLVEKYQHWQRKRFAVPQGMTGWWQIHGRSDKPMHLHTEDDLYYIQNYSIWLDIEILIKTAWIVIRGKGAY